MADEPKDVIREHNTPATLTLNLKEKMFAWDITNNRFGVKLAGGAMKWISDDLQQVLIAGPQTITGQKTFNLSIKTLATKLLTLDDIGGFRLQDAAKYTISDDDALYTIEKLLSVFGGDLEILDHGQNLGEDILTGGDFGSDPDWSETGDFSQEINGSGHLEYNHSAGSGTVEQVSTDFDKRHFVGEWYVFTYDVIAAGTGDLAITIHSDTTDDSVTLDLTLGTLKKKFFRFKSGATTFKLSGTSTSGTVELDNFIVERLGGAVQAKQFGPGGPVEISGEGDIESTFDANNSGWLGGPDSAINRRGIQFHKSGAGRVSKSLDISSGGNAGLDTDQTLRRMAFEAVQTAQSVASSTVQLDFPTNTVNNIGSNFIMNISGTKDDGSLGFGAAYMCTFRRTGGSLVQVGSESVIASTVDEFSAVTVNIFVSGDNIRLELIPPGSHNIDWTAGLIGVGNLFADRTV